MGRKDRDGTVGMNQRMDDGRRGIEGFRRADQYVGRAGAASIFGNTCLSQGFHKRTGFSYLIVAQFIKHWHTDWLFIVKQSTP